MQNKNYKKRDSETEVATTMLKKSYRLQDKHLHLNEINCGKYAVKKNYSVPFKLTKSKYAKQHPTPPQKRKKERSKKREVLALIFLLLSDFVLCPSFKGYAP